MSQSLLCARSGCNVAFRPRGNQRYCSLACSLEARLVQNRRAQRRHRLREHFAIIEEARKTGHPLQVSAVRPRLLFRLPLRRLPPLGPPARPAAFRLLLQLLPP